MRQHTRRDGIVKPARAAERPAGLGCVKNGEGGPRLAETASHGKPAALQERISPDFAFEK